MSKADYAKCSNLFVITFLIIFIQFCSSAPVIVAENTYTQLVSELIRNQCYVPSQVHLPFNSTKVNNFEYLSSSLEICQNSESTKRNKEAVVLCKEIFDNIRNISCPTKTALPDINVGLSENVCQDIGSLKGSVPEEDKTLLKRLTDGFLCDIMCDYEFEKACQVLLWSFEVRKQIASIASSKELKQPIVPGEDGDMNVDTIKQDNMIDRDGVPGIGDDPENEQANDEEAKNVNVIEHDGVHTPTKPSKLEDNPAKKVDTLHIFSERLKQGEPDPSVKESSLENQPVPNAKSQESTSASQSTSSVKTQSSVTEQNMVTGLHLTDSDTEFKPAAEMTKGESRDENQNKQLQSVVTNNEGVNVEGDLPYVPNTKVISNEPERNVYVNTLADKTVQDKKHTDTLANEHAQDNSSIPVPQTVPANEGNNVGSESPNEADKGKISNSLINNELPHESANEKIPNDAAANLPNGEQNLSSLVSTIDQNKLQDTPSNNDSMTKKLDSFTNNSQIVKVSVQQPTIQETTQDKTSIAGDATKVDKTNSGLKIEEQTRIEIPNDHRTDDGSSNLSTDQKNTKVAQQTEEFDNTIPESTEGPIIIDERPQEKNQKSKPTVVNPDGKSAIPSSLTETSTKTTVALEEMEGGSELRQPVNDADIYRDQDNTEGDEYPADYDGVFGDVPKSKASDPDLPRPIVAAKEIIPNPDEKLMEFPSRNAFGQDAQMISPFPEQEDSHFFFYFLSIVLIMMAGYLIFHNKQKIIALIVEGRHERNRRSHRIGYKKLETK